MKKCAECQKELDKFSIVCEYCGVLPGDGQRPRQESTGKVSTQRKIAEIERNIKKGKRA